GLQRGAASRSARSGPPVGLTPFNLLGRLPRVAFLPRPRPGPTPRPAALGGLGRLTVDDPRRWARFAAGHLARLQQQRKIDLLEQAVVSPIVEITLHGSERRKVLRQHPPLTAGPRDIQDRVKHGSQLDLARS